MTDTKRPDGFDALPARFKRYIADIETRERELRKALPSATKTAVRMVNYMDKAAEVYLPSDSRIAFSVGRTEFLVQLADDGIEVRTDLSGLMIEPNVSNSVLIKERKR